MNKAEEAMNIINRFSVPEELTDNALLTYDGTGANIAYALTPISKVDENTRFVHSLDRNQQGYIADQISQIISKQNSKDVRYRLQPLQKSYDLVHSKTKEGDIFKENIMKPGWIHNLERLKHGKITPDSVTCLIDEQFNYYGKTIDAKINENDIFDIMIEAGLFKKPKEKVYRGSVYFENGEFSVGSGWSGGGGCFVADAGGPSDGVSGGRAVFEKTAEKVDFAKIEIAKEEYAELLDKSKKYEELKRKFDEFKKII